MDDTVKVITGFLLFIVYTLLSLLGFYFFALSLIIGLDVHDIKYPKALFGFFLLSMLCKLLSRGVLKATKTITNKANN